jgi:hypothetical protein
MEPEKNEPPPEDSAAGKLLKSMDDLDDDTPTASSTPVSPADAINATVTTKKLVSVKVDEHATEAKKASSEEGTKKKEGKEVKDSH